MALVRKYDAGGRPVMARPALASRSDRCDAAAVPSVALLTLKESYRIKPRSESISEGILIALPANPRQMPASAFTEPLVLLDDTNVRLLAQLHANPRITMSALGRRIGMSPPAVTE